MALSLSARAVVPNQQALAHKGREKSMDVGFCRVNRQPAEAREFQCDRALVRTAGKKIENDCASLIAANDIPVLNIEQNCSVVLDDNAQSFGELGHDATSCPWRRS